MSSLLPHFIANVLYMGRYEDQKCLIFDSLGNDFKKLINANANRSPHYYVAVCLWAKQMVIIATIEIRMRFDFPFISSTDRSTQISSPAEIRASRYQT